MKILADPARGAVVLIFDDVADRQMVIEHLQGMGDNLLYCQYSAEELATAPDIEALLDALQGLTGGGEVGDGS